MLTNLSSSRFKETLLQGDKGKESITYGLDMQTPISQNDQ